MSRRIVITVLIWFVSLLGLAEAQGPSVGGRAINVSLIRLIANPQAFDGRHVRIAGYLANNGLDKAVGVYVTELDGRNFIIANSVDLDVEESTVDRFVGKYVIFDATFHAPSGPLADYLNGRLDRVSGIRLWNQGDPPK